MSEEKKKTTRAAKLYGLLSGLGAWALLSLVSVLVGVFFAQVLGIGILEIDIGLIVFMVLLFLLGPVLAVFVGRFINSRWESYTNSKKYLLNIISSSLVLAVLFILVKPNSENSDKDNGLKTFWYKNGQMKNQVNFKNGKKDGSAVMWHENGQKMEEIMFKNDQKDGLETQWYENGQKKFEINYKDGKIDGLAVTWHENEQKKWEAIFKDGEKISEKFWNSKDEPVDSLEEAEK
jgi:hypothetical protein